MSYIGWRVSEVRADRRGFGSNELKANEPDTRLLGDVRLAESHHSIAAVPPDFLPFMSQRPVDLPHLGHFLTPL